MMSSLQYNSYAVISDIVIQTSSMYYNDSNLANLVKYISLTISEDFIELENTRPGETPSSSDQTNLSVSTCCYGP